MFSGFFISIFSFYITTRVGGLQLLPTEPLLSGKEISSLEVNMKSHSGFRKQRNSASSSVTEPQPGGSKEGLPLKSPAVSQAVVSSNGLKISRRSGSDMPALTREESSLKRFFPFNLLLTIVDIRYDIGSRCTTQ